MRDRGRLWVVVGSALALGTGGCAGRQAGTAGSGAAACGGALPSADLQPPAGNALALALEAAGVQVYTCTAKADGGADWVFTAPEATLRAADGTAAGKHYAGPTWEAADGSTVAGAKVAAATPDGTAIPWLLLRATTHGGAGGLADVTFIQRVATRGGLAPPDGCVADTVGAVARVPYAASYCFLTAR